jgi:hypothetical protein
MSEISGDLVSCFNSRKLSINPRIRNATWHYWLRKRGTYQCLPRKDAVNTPLSLTVKGLAGSCMLLCFGISLETVQLMVTWCCSVWDRDALKAFASAATSSSLPAEDICALGGAWAPPV